MKNLSVFLLIITLFFLSGCTSEKFLPQGYTIDNYTIVEVTNITCTMDEKCETPMKYLIQSNCPYTSLCLENMCTIICPNFK